MQKLLRVAPWLKGRGEPQDAGEVAGAADCPFCPLAHRLRRHGFYERWALLVEGGVLVEHRVRVRRLLCPRTGRTVSLLPAVCIPRRQHGPEALGTLLDAYALAQQGLLAAYRCLRPGAESHSVPQHLVGGFLRRRPQWTAYLGGLRARVPLPPPGLEGRRLEVARLLLPLREGHPGGPQALRLHGVPFHERFALGVA